VIFARPLVQSGAARAPGALPLCGGSLWFTHVDLLDRSGRHVVRPADSVSPDLLARLTQARDPIVGLSMSKPRVMGIVNVTPDSFSDGGQITGPETALSAAREMVKAGVDILDIGGESTRPGAATVSVEDEIARVAPAIANLSEMLSTPISIDTRKAPVARAAISAGAGLINDVSGFTYDPDLADVAKAQGVPICVMHAQGTPETMQVNPVYLDVLLDVYEDLSHKVDALEAGGIPRNRIVIDPGIGFGKTVAHNLRLLQNISLFHGIGCAILLGVSRKGFVGQIGRAPNPEDRAPGSIALGLAALGQGVQILRVHDVAETAQAVRLWRAVNE